jgi:hypothetical protein
MLDRSPLPGHADESSLEASWVPAAVYNLVIAVVAVQ